MASVIPHTNHQKTKTKTQTPNHNPHKPKKKMLSGAGWNLTVKGSEYVLTALGPKPPLVVTATT